MRKIQINKFWIFAGTTAFMLMFIYAVIKIYDLTLSETKRSHQLQQMEMAKAATTGIKYHLSHLLEDMQLLTFFREIQELNPDQVSRKVDQIYHHYTHRVVKSIIITDLRANIIYTKGDISPTWIIPSIKKQIDRLQEVGITSDCWYSQVNPNDENAVEKGFSFLMIIPIKMENPGIKEYVTSDSVIGTVCYLVDFDLLIQQFISPLKLSKNDFAWVIDGNGRLVFHPNHKEMILRSTKDASLDCMPCHASFDVQNKMLSNKASTGEYSIGDEPTKIMAYVPIDLEDERWVLAISTFLPEVTASLRNKFQMFFILGLVILVYMISFGLLLYYVNAKRIRAEEAERQYEQLQQLQVQLNQAAKLASIGELVDTVAHEINTPIGIIAAQADAMQLQNESSSMYNEELSSIKAQTRRISKYTRSLLTYSQRIPFRPQPVHIKELLNECIYLLGHRLRAEKISVFTNYPPKIPKLILDRGQMEQVFINLLNNAIDAIQGTGKIGIVVSLVNRNKVSPEDISVEGIQIDISDNGIGIPESDLPQIFEPFFSTKLETKGTGLGLSISKAIIQRHRGRIKVSSTSGKGTTFHIFLPLRLEGN